MKQDEFRQAVKTRTDNDAVTPGELGDVFSQLPEEYTVLFKAPLA